MHGVSGTSFRVLCSDLFAPETCAWAMRVSDVLRYVLGHVIGSRYGHVFRHGGQAWCSDMCFDMCLDTCYACIRHFVEFRMSSEKKTFSTLLFVGMWFEDVAQERHV